MFIGAVRKSPGTGERGEIKRCSVTTTFRRRPFNRRNPLTRFLPIAQGIYSQQLNWERWTLHPVSLCSCVSLKLPAYISKSSGPTSGRVSDGCYLNLSSNSIRFRRSQIGFECKNTGGRWGQKSAFLVRLGRTRSPGADCSPPHTSQMMLSYKERKHCRLRQQLSCAWVNVRPAPGDTSQKEQALTCVVHMHSYNKSRRAVS